MKRKVVSLVLCAALAASALIGCSAGSEAGGGVIPRRRQKKRLRQVRAPQAHRKWRSKVMM